MGSTLMRVDSLLRGLIHLKEKHSGAKDTAARDRYLDMMNHIRRELVGSISLNIVPDIPVTFGLPGWSDIDIKNGDSVLQVLIPSEESRTQGQREKEARRLYKLIHLGMWLLDMHQKVGHLNNKTNSLKATGLQLLHSYYKGKKTYGYAINVKEREIYFSFGLTIHIRPQEAPPLDSLWLPDAITVAETIQVAVKFLTVIGPKYCAKLPPYFSPN